MIRKYNSGCRGPSATRVILSNQEYPNPIYEGLNEALEFEKTKVLIFGKPVSRKGRRMGVVLSSNSDINLAKLMSEFDERTTPILLPFLETGLPNMSTLVFSNSNASLRPS